MRYLRVTKNGAVPELAGRQGITPRYLGNSLDA